VGDLPYEIKHRAYLATGPEGDTLLSLCDGKGKIRVVMGVRPDGSPSITLLDDKGKERDVLGTAQTISDKTGVKHQHPESSLLLSDKDGNLIFQAP